MRIRSFRKFGLVTRSKRPKAEEGRRLALFRFGAAELIGRRKAWNIERSRLGAAGTTAEQPVQPAFSAGMPVYRVRAGPACAVHRPTWPFFSFLSVVRRSPSPDIRSLRRREAFTLRLARAGAGAVPPARAQSVLRLFPSPEIQLPSMLGRVAWSFPTSARLIM